MYLLSCSYCSTHLKCANLTKNKFFNTYFDFVGGDGVVLDGDDDYDVAVVLDVVPADVELVVVDADSDVTIAVVDDGCVTVVAVDSMNVL